MAGSRIDAAMRLVHVHRKLGGRLIQDKYPSHYMPHVGRQVAGAYATKGFVDEEPVAESTETVYDPMGNVAMPGTAAPSDEKEPARGSRVLEGFAKGFGHQPLGFSEENKAKYPLTTGTWQPFAAPIDAALRLPGGIAGAAAGAVGAGTEAATGDTGFANRAERQARDFADFLMIEAGQVRPRAPTHTDSIPRGGDILPRETVQRPAIERAGPPTIEGEVVGGAPKALPEPPRAMLDAPKEPIEPVRAVEPSPEAPRAMLEAPKEVLEPVQAVAEAPAEPAGPLPVAPMTRSEANQKIKELRQSMAGLEKDSPEFKAIQEQMKEINLQVQSKPQEPSVATPAPVKEVVPAREAPPRNISPLGLYSHGAEAAHLLPMDKGTPQQIKAALVTKFAVKPAELEGFDEAFAGKKTVTRDEVAKFFENNRPQLEEVQYGGKSVGDPYEQMHDAAQKLAENENAFREASQGFAGPEFSEFANTEERANYLLEQRPEILDIYVREQASPPSRFEQHTEPGGENYRELLIKRKGASTAPPEQVWKVSGAHPGTFATQAEAQNYVTQLQQMRESAINDPSMEVFVRDIDRFPINIYSEDKPVPRGEDEGYFHEHYPGQKDVIAAPRLIDRYDAEGNLVLNAEEIQSDMAQAGQEEGFKPKKDLAEEKRLRNEITNSFNERQQAMKDFNKLYEEVQKDKIRESFKDALTPYDLPNALKEREKWFESVDPERLFTSFRSEFLRRDQSLLSRMSEDQINKMQDAYEKYIGARDAHQEAVYNRDDYISKTNKGIVPAPYVTATKDWVDLTLKRLLKEAVDGGYKKFVWTPADRQFSRWGSEMVRWEKVPGEDGAWMVDASGFIRPVAMKALPKMNPHSDDVISSRDELYNTIEYAVGDRKKAAAMADKAWEKMQKEDSGSVIPRKEGMEGFYGNAEHKSGVPPIVYARMKALLSKIDPDAKIGSHEIVTHKEGKPLDPGKNHPNTTMMPGVEITPKMIEAVRKGLPERARGGSIVDKALMLKSSSASPPSGHEIAMRIAKQHRGTPRRS